MNHAALDLTPIDLVIKQTGIHEFANGDQHEFSTVKSAEPWLDAIELPSRRVHPQQCPGRAHGSGFDAIAVGRS